MLIDFGLARSFWHHGHTHIEESKLPRFMGNCMFASYNAFKNIVLSRRDDFISLGYLLVYLFEGQNTW
jgi:hypothetical protein